MFSNQPLLNVHAPPKLFQNSFAQSVFGWGGSYQKNCCAVLSVFLHFFTSVFFGWPHLLLTHFSTPEIMQKRECLPRAIPHTQKTHTPGPQGIPTGDSAFSINSLSYAPPKRFKTLSRRAFLVGVAATWKWLCCPRRVPAIFRKCGFRLVACVLNHIFLHRK